MLFQEAAEKSPAHISLIPFPSWLPREQAAHRAGLPTGCAMLRLRPRCPLLGQELGTDLQPELWPGGAAVQERPGSSAWVPVGMSGSPCQVGLAACPSAERCARCHAARKSVTRNKGCLLKMLPDCLPSSCFLHSGEIIRNDFILTAQMNTKWNLGYYYCSERAADWNLNGRAAQPRRFGSGTHSGAASQSTLPHQSRQLLSARCL